MQLGVERDARSNVKAAPTRRPSRACSPQVTRAAASLIVWAINEGRQCARVADRYLSGLPGARSARRGVGAAPPSVSARPIWGADRPDRRRRLMSISSCWRSRAAPSGPSPASRCPGKDPMTWCNRRC